MSTKQKIKRITDLFSKLYCFKKREIDEYMKRIPYMKDEGLAKLIKNLEDGLKDQDKMLEKWTERDPAYANNLTDFAIQTTKGLIKEFEAAEKNSAEDILNEIE